MLLSPNPGSLASPEQESGALGPPHRPSDWKHLAEEASKEMDPERLTELVTDLTRVLGEREELPCLRKKPRLFNFLAIRA
jgi:hypothetical protein